MEENLRKEYIPPTIHVEYVELESMFADGSANIIFENTSDGFDTNVTDWQDPTNINGNQSVEI
ncbi:hypothetical protein BAY13_17025 [Elizabethkingia bruuniana]|uniref:hypothetical protein n=1 Tax=Elizabethkingia bruuniana TaxID=1756149 RepID=UPI00099AF6BB|nr:hypothetical protein [Elizabethkingia bruuniana]OPC66439.1 hypothetical protein BAY13_17025 [Elizabethkingia bruuniana]